MQEKNVFEWRSPVVWGSLLLILMVLASFRLRMPELERVTGAPNLEATYHVLLTAVAMDESPLANHWMLPTVSLGSPLDKGIAWGATIPTKTGDYVYTSFTPPGFIAPYLWFKALGQAPSSGSLAIFNALLGAVTAYGLFCLLFALLKLNGYSPSVSVAAALLGSTISIFSREALLSHGLTYWSQCLYQPILVCSLYLFYRYLRADGGRSFYARGLIVAAFLGPLTEWTGYVFNAGIIAVLYWHGARRPVPDPGMRVLAWILFLVSAAAAFATVAYYSLATGVGPAVSAFLARFLERGAARGTLADLISGYGLSYGLFLLILVAIMAVAFFFKPASAGGVRIEHEDHRRITFLVFLAACFPLLENIVMLQHATQFSYDRLKFIFPAALILAFSFARSGVRGRVLLSFVIALACVGSFYTYQQDLRRYAEWSAIDTRNRQLAAQVLSRVDAGCAVFSSNIAVRGYANLLFQRGMHEWKKLSASVALMDASKACALVYLEGDTPFPDLPRYARATLVRPDGTREVVQ